MSAVSASSTSMTSRSEMRLRATKSLNKNDVWKTPGKFRIGHRHSLRGVCVSTAPDQVQTLNFKDHPYHASRHRQPGLRYQEGCRRDTSERLSALRILYYSHPGSCH